MNEFDTHEVFNQAPPFADVNLFACDPALAGGACSAKAPAGPSRRCARWARTLGRAETLDLGRQANANPPRLVNFDRSGRRIDEVEFHPSWHQLMALMIGAGVHASPWDSGQRRRAGGARGAVPAVRPGRKRRPVPGDDDVCVGAGAAPGRRHRATNGCRRSCRANTIRARCRSSQKRGALIGMGMTEKQGGTDVRANTTRAEPFDAGRGAAPLWRGGRGRLAHRRPQMVLLGAAVRRAPDPGADRRRRQRRPVVLLRAALPARRQPQRRSACSA